MFPKPQFIETNGVRLAVYQDGDGENGKGIPVVLCHGFPELAYSWRHQFPALANAGCRVIAADQRGYGDSDAPPDIIDYDIKNLSGDLIGLLDALDIEKAVFCGHDWGALIMWSMPFLYPERVLGLCGLNVPFMPRGSLDPLSAMVRAFGPNHYINFFQKPGEAEALFEKDPAKSHRFFMRRVGNDAQGGRPSDEYIGHMKQVALQNLFLMPEDQWRGQELLNADELNYYASKFAKSGYRGPINWYRNFERNWRYMADFQPPFEGKPLIHVPVLMLVTDKDAVLPAHLAEPMPNFCSDLTLHLIENCGHWTQQEKPDEVNRLMVDWLNNNFSNG